MTIGSRIREARKERGMTAASLAEKTGQDAPTISRWENDRREPDANHLRVLCDALGVTADYLLERT